MNEITCKDLNYFMSVSGVQGNNGSKFAFNTNLCIYFFYKFCEYMYRKWLHKFMKICYKPGCNHRLSAWLTLPYSWWLLADVAMPQWACWYLQTISVITCCIQMEMEFTTASATTTAIATATVTVTATPTIWYIVALHFPHIHIPYTTMVVYCW